MINITDEPKCPHCLKQMKIVKVKNDNEFHYFWKCECSIQTLQDEYDKLNLWKEIYNESN